MALWWDLYKKDLAWHGAWITCTVASERTNNLGSCEVGSQVFCIWLRALEWSGTEDTAERHTLSLHWWGFYSSAREFQQTSASFNTHFRQFNPVVKTSWAEGKRVIGWGELLYRSRSQWRLAEDMTSDSIGSRRPSGEDHRDHAVTVTQQVDEALGETAQRHETWYHVELQGR